jgi:hypothetical protein
MFHKISIILQCDEGMVHERLTEEETHAGTEGDSKVLRRAGSCMAWACSGGSLAELGLALPSVQDRDGGQPTVLVCSERRLGVHDGFLESCALLPLDKELCDLGADLSLTRHFSGALVQPLCGGAGRHTEGTRGWPRPWHARPGTRCGGGSAR